MLKYPSVEYMRIVFDYLDEYIPNRAPIDIKPKRDQLIRKEYAGLYRIQLDALSIIKDIEISHLLGMNEVVVDPLIDEYRRLNYILKFISDRLKVMKQFDNELGGFVSDMMKSFRVSELSSMLYSDLELLSSEYDLDLDFKSCISEYKGYEPSKEYVEMLNNKIGKFI